MPKTISNQNKFLGNPRKMSAKEKEQLKKHLESLGDLSGVIYDINSKSFVGGNQRSDIFDGAPITITERFDKPTKNKTVAHGFILYKGEKFAYREVAFTESEFREACIVANNDGGAFDLEILSGWDEYELEEWGFDVGVFEEISEPKNIEKKNLEPFKKVHILLSFEPDQLNEVMKHIKEIPFEMEIEQGAN